MEGALFAPATSHRIEEVPHGLLRKDLRETAMVPAARGTKPAFVHDVRREPAVYRALLTPLSIGPRCLASGADWVLIERLDAVPLWQVGDAATWVAVAAWLAGMHRRLALGSAGAPGLPLLVHDEVLLAAWRRRGAEAGVPRPVLAAHERAAARLARLPATVVHGDLYPSNVLVRRGARQPGGLGVWPVDWELAGMGPAVLDVAAFTAGGGWDPATRTAMARAYFDAAGGCSDAWPAWSVDLDAARLHLCVQWLGWMPGWTPPAEHRHDWLGEALQLAAAL